MATQPSAAASDDADQKRLEADVRKLLFADCRDTTTWDHLGNLEPVRRPQHKSVHISTASPDVFDDHLELVPLPAGLALLYDAAQERGATVNNPLLYALDILSGPPPAADAYDRLYQLAVERKRRMDAEDAERKRLAQEEEDRQCTFHPEVSEHAKKLPSKLKVDGGFYSEGLKWRHEAEKKLRKKVEKEQKDKWEETMETWHMNPRSVKLAERARQRAADAQVANARPRCITPRNGRRTVASEPGALAFSPIINRRPAEEVLRSLGLEGSDGDEERTLDPPIGREATAACIQRLQQDIAGRRQRQAMRAKQFVARQKEKLFDKITGQPLFQPNAMPMVQNTAGETVPFAELSKQEKAAYLKKFKSHAIDFVPAIAAAKAREPRRDLDVVVETMLKHQSDSNLKLAKKRRKVAEEEAQECLFKPKVDRRSAEIASAASRPPFSERLSQVSATRSRHSTTPDKPPEPKLTSEQLQLLLWRQEQFRETVERNAAKTKASADLELETQCTFKPKVNRVSSQLVTDAERRLTVEYPSHPKLQVVSPDRGGALGLEVPPPTERSRSHLDPNRFDPQRHGSFGPLYRTMYGSFDSSCIETSGSFSRRRPGASQTSSPRPTLDEETPRPEKAAKQSAPEVTPADAMLELQTLLNSWSAFTNELERKVSL